MGEVIGVGDEEQFRYDIATVKLQYVRTNDQEEKEFIDLPLIGCD
jgi:hypothetical protein